MAGKQQQLEQRAHRLAEQGADPLRLEVLSCARQFKRSWVDMARALTKVHQRRAYVKWGYPDLYAYCAEELLIKKATVDKLTGSYFALERHAPKLLEADGIQQPIPSHDSVDYFARALGERGSRPPKTPPAVEVLDELKRAVFENAQPLSALRQQFDPVLYAKSDQEKQQALLAKARAEVRRLLALLPDLPGLSRRRIAEVEAALEALGRDLERLEPRDRKTPAKGRRDRQDVQATSG